jgi:hypothetical protein
MLSRHDRLAKPRRLASVAGRVVALALVWGIGLAHTAQAAWATTVLPVLAQAAQKTAAPETPAEGGSWPVLDWLIVVVLLGAALFTICRSSRRN